MTLHGHLNAHSNEAVGMRKITACRLTPGNVNYIWRDCSRRCFAARMHDYFERRLQSSFEVVVRQGVI